MSCYQVPSLVPGLDIHIYSPQRYSHTCDYNRRALTQNTRRRLQKIISLFLMSPLIIGKCEWRQHLFAAIMRELTNAWNCFSIVRPLSICPTLFKRRTMKLVSLRTCQRTFGVVFHLWRHTLLRCCFDEAADGKSSTLYNWNRDREQHRQNVDTRNDALLQKVMTIIKADVQLISFLFFIC